MLKKIFKKKKHSSDGRSRSAKMGSRDNYFSIEEERSRSAEITGRQQYFSIDEEKRRKSVDSAVNPTYVLRATKDSEQIRISHFASNGTYMNVEERPCYANIDTLYEKCSSRKEDDVYQDIWSCNTGQVRHVRANMYEVCNAVQIQEDQLKDVTSQRWYFWCLSREGAEARLRYTAPSTFLVRQSSKDGSFILSLKSLAGPIAHIRINEVGQGYSLDGSTKVFYTIGQMMTYFSSNEIVIKQLATHQILCHGLLNR